MVIHLEKTKVFFRQHQQANENSRHSHLIFKFTLLLFNKIGFKKFRFD